MYKAKIILTEGIATVYGSTSDIGTVTITVVDNVAVRFTHESFDENTVAVSTLVEYFDSEVELTASGNDGFVDVNCFNPSAVNADHYHFQIVIY
jgi:hypothetical protein